MKIDPKKIILRPPTKEEVRAADTNPSDYQIAQLRILSKILFDFGLVSKVYRAKKATIARNNVKRIEKLKTVFRTFLQSFNSEEPVVNVRRALNLVKDELFTSVEFINIITATKDLRDESQLLRNVSTVYRNVMNYDEPTDEDVIAVRKIYNKLADYVNTELTAGHEVGEIKRGIMYANTINHLMEEDELENAHDLVYSDPNVNTVSDLEADIDQYLTEQQSQGKYGHANTILHDEALDNLRKLSIKMKNDGFSGNLTPGNIFEYMKSNEPAIIDYVSSNYNISPDELNGEKFPTWESVAQFFYSPEMIRHIELELLKVDQRSRAVGENRKGALLAVDAKTVQNRKEALARQMEKKENTESPTGTLKAKLDAKEKEYEEAKKIRDNVKADYEEAQRRGEDKEMLNQLAQKYEEAKTIAFKIGKTAASIRHALKLATEAGTQDEVIKSDIERMKDLEKEEKQIIAQARKHLGDDDDIRAFDAAYKNEEDKVNQAWDFDDTWEIDYRTWSFVVNSVNDKITDYIVAQLQKGLSSLNKYVNVDKFEPEYPEIRGTQIVIDYPAESKLTMILEKKPKFAYEIMDSVVYVASTKFDKNVSYYNDEEYIKINSKFLNNSKF